MQFFRFVWSSIVWCACVAGPFYVLWKYGPYWTLGAAVAANFVWIVFGDVGGGNNQHMERLGYTRVPRLMVFYISLVAAVIALYKLAVQFNFFIIRH